MTFKYSNFRALKSVNPKALPLHPARGPKAGPWTPPKNRLALTRSLCALRAHVCPPPQKKIGSRLRARYVRSAHMFAQKKSDPSNSKKSARASRSLCALRAHVCPPIINRCPLLAPPLFKSWCRLLRRCLHEQRLPVLFPWGLSLLR